MHAINAHGGPKSVDSIKGLFVEGQRLHGHLGRVAAEHMEVPQLRQLPDGRRHGTRDAVPAEQERLEVHQLAYVVRNNAAQEVVRQVEALQAHEQAQLGGNDSRDAVVLQVQDVELLQADHGDVQAAADQVLTELEHAQHGAVVERRKTTGKSSVTVSMHTTKANSHK